MSWKPRFAVACVMVVQYLPGVEPRAQERTPERHSTEAYCDTALHMLEKVTERDEALREQLRTEPRPEARAEIENQALQTASQLGNWRKVVAECDRNAQRRNAFKSDGAYVDPFSDGAPGEATSRTPAPRTEATLPPQEVAKPEAPGTDAGARADKDTSGKAEQIYYSVNICNALDWKRAMQKEIATEKRMGVVDLRNVLELNETIRMEDDRIRSNRGALKSRGRPALSCSNVVVQLIQACHDDPSSDVRCKKIEKYVDDYIADYDDGGRSTMIVDPDILRPSERVE